ncbi:hypothetical protein Tco_0725552 [Tanacetum coccineum]|uniref:Reverse transcriptase RNase H-like domain-containing protein n=1 Tax=Tanacetum coccineum TaxID=301880 RepID=A0ABQ4YE23_9ASTR
MALALRHASRRLRRYFEAHPITVITDQPIKQVLNNADTSGRLAPYSVELAAYNITYEPRSAVKGQILADFINEVPVGSGSMTLSQTQYTIGREKDRKEEWILYTDGASSAKGSGAGLVLISPTKTEYTELRVECIVELDSRLIEDDNKSQKDMCFVFVNGGAWIGRAPSKVSTANVCCRIEYIAGQKLPWKLFGIRNFISGAWESERARHYQDDSIIVPSVLNWAIIRIL